MLANDQQLCREVADDVQRTRVRSSESYLAAMKRALEENLGLLLATQGLHQGGHGHQCLDGASVVRAQGFRFLQRVLRQGFGLLKAARLPKQRDQIVHRRKGLGVRAAQRRLPAAQHTANKWLCLFVMADRLKVRREVDQCLQRVLVVGAEEGLAGVQRDPEHRSGLHVLAHGLQQQRRVAQELQRRGVGGAKSGTSTFQGALGHVLGLLQAGIEAQCRRVAIQCNHRVWVVWAHQRFSAESDTLEQVTSFHQVPHHLQQLSQAAQRQHRVDVGVPIRLLPRRKHTPRDDLGLGVLADGGEDGRDLVEDLQCLRVRGA
mmetsp:Transcript_170427/g.546458  ORF Transcript_170427/g.546458 Transcript_170427/m.546458 type:complete len:318 (+) Transcript_170427:1248-2201(+)